MITVFDDTQRSHAPREFIVAGKPQPIPERPQRIDMLMEGVRRLGGPVVPPPEISGDTIALVHDRRYIQFLSTVWERWQRLADAAETPAANVFALGRPGLPPAHYPDSVVGQCGWHLGDGSAPITAQTWAAARASAATAAHGAKLVLEGERIAYALCRPPGHHAAADVAAGFCYLNNAALAAALFAGAGRRTAVLDIDVHHGNGTEAIFYDRADVLTISLHVHPGRFYPFFWGYAEETGRDAGEGFNLNLPMERGTTIRPYLASLEAALQRIAGFGAEVVVVAAGLDIAVDDPFRGFAIQTAEFAEIGRHIGMLQLPMLVVQEGGYPSPNLGLNLEQLLRGLSA
ncbi:histone deacetylase family protein [Aestuariivirga sp.]|uniref:histone deacetylase family protein n=1 Tax=Aestuariivirga sp. TaxID=2650926 RepID=UPI0025C24F00|nr:histone deacetylase family protein [Aestuariivirga sp.]MCA3556272.1 histone deacetylase family protein [Aestuariivirga sp.]